MKVGVEGSSGTPMKVKSSHIARRFIRYHAKLLPKQKKTKKKISYKTIPSISLMICFSRVFPKYIKWQLLPVSLTKC